jgi:hypothetical protein
MKPPTQRLCFILLGVCLAQPSELLAEWKLERAGDIAKASVSGDRGGLVAVYRDERDRIVLDLRVKQGFSGLAREHCPTLQIDERKPLFHTTIGDDCSVEADRALISLATVTGNELVSAPVYGLLNGQVLAVRYVGEDGTYHEAMFSLKRSAEAIRSAIGRELRVDAE